MNVPSPARRILAVVAVIGILTLGTGAVAVAATTTPAPTTPWGEEDRQGPQFYAGPSVEISGEVDGDVYASGQSVTISGDVTGDVIAAAQTITVTGTVDGNVRLAGQDVTIVGAVSRSGTVFAANITIADEGSFGDDLVAAAGTIRIGGEVGRDLLLGVERLTIDGSVGGSVTYYSDADARIDEGAVDGAVERIESPEPPRTEVSPWAALVGWFLGALYALVSLSLVMLVAGLLAPRWLQRVTDHLIPSPWKALLVGFVASIAVPAALMFLLVTIIGAPLALAGMLVWLLLTLATFVYSSFYIGRLLFRGDQHPIIKALVGGLLLIIALQIPWLNIVVWIAMLFFGLGAQLLEFYYQRPWATKPKAELATPTTIPGTVAHPGQPPTER